MAFRVHRYNVRRPSTRVPRVKRALSRAVHMKKRVNFKKTLYKRKTYKRPYIRRSVKPNEAPKEVLDRLLDNTVGEIYTTGGNSCAWATHGLFGNPGIVAALCSKQGTDRNMSVKVVKQTYDYTFTNTSNRIQYVDLFLFKAIQSLDAGTGTTYTILSAGQGDDQQLAGTTAIGFDHPTFKPWFNPRFMQYFRYKGRKTIRLGVGSEKHCRYSNKQTHYYSQEAIAGTLTTSVGSWVLLIRVRGQQVATTAAALIGDSSTSVVWSSKAEWLFSLDTSGKRVGSVYNYSPESTAITSANQIAWDKATGAKVTGSIQI